MTANEICKVIQCASKNGVENLTIDKINIKFKNDNSISGEQPETPIEVVTPQPSQENIQEEIDKLSKAEELSLMMIEDPVRYEQLIADDPELIKDFEESIED